MNLVEMLQNLSKVTSLGLLDSAGKHTQAPLVIDRLKNDSLIQESRFVQNEFSFVEFLAISCYFSQLWVNFIELVKSCNT